MNNPTVFLERYGKLVRRIESRLEEIERLRSLSTKATASYSEVPSHSGSVRSQIEENLIRREALLEKLVQDWSDLVTCREEIGNVLKQLSPQNQDVLFWRYINCWNWRRIIDALGVSRSRVFQIHSAALQEVCKILANR